MPESLYRADIVRVTGHPVQQVILRMVNPYTFRAGQHLQVQAPDGMLIPLSIASSPTRLPELELHYRSIAGMAEAKVMDTLLTGSTLSVTRATGDVRSGAPNQALFVIAGGNGAAQAFSCAEYRDATKARAQTTILWCADQADDIYCQEILQNYSGVELHITTDNRRTPDNEGLMWLVKHCKDYHHAYVILSGGPGFVYAATDILLAHNFTRSQLHADAYTYAPRE